MKILLLAPHPFYRERGTPIAVDRMLRVLSDGGHDVDVLTFHEGDSPSYPNVTLHRIPSPPGIRDVPPGFSAKKLVCDALMFFKGLGLVRRTRPQVIHAVEESVFMATEYRVLFKVPFVYDMDSCLSEQLVDKKPWLSFGTPAFRWLEARATRGALAVVPVCRSLADTAERYGARRVVVLPDISLLDPAPTRDETDVVPGNGDTQFMYIGNLESYQGIDLMLPAFSLAHQRCAGIRLVVIGGRAARVKRYARASRGMGLEGIVEFRGPRPVSAIADHLRAADVLISPRTQGANTPMKIYSYLHSGKPVLATRLPTHTQVLTDEIAFLAEPDAESMADGMVTLAGDADLRRRLGRSGHAYAEQHHTFDAFRKTLGDLYRDLETAVTPYRG